MTIERPELVASRKVSSHPIYLVKLSILIVASENRSEVCDKNVVFNIAPHVLWLDISVQTIHLVHVFQTIEQLHSYVGNYGVKGLIHLHFLLNVLEDGERKVLHDEEATALKGRVILILRAFTQLFLVISQEQALCEHVGGSWWQWVKLDCILVSRTLFLKDAHCALATESDQLQEMVFAIADLQGYLITFRRTPLWWWYTLRLHI